MTTLVSPSLLAADFANLSGEIDTINRSEADWLHCDVMDGSFVPNISFGFPVLEAVKRISRKPLDVHFMIVHPERYIARTARLGAMMMTVHQEACIHLDRTIHEIHEAGMKAGVALNPATPVALLEDVLAENTLAKVQRLRRLIAESSSHALIQVDGGVNGDTAPRLVRAGVDVLVSGSYVFGAERPGEVIGMLKRLGAERA